MHDQPLCIRHQHAFAGAIEHGGGLAQAFAVFFQGLLQLMGPGKPSADQVNRQGAERHPYIAAHLQPVVQLTRVIDKLDQYALSDADPQNGNQQVYQPRKQGTSV